MSPYILDAACLCNTGKVRNNNEDNLQVNSLGEVFI